MSWQSWREDICQQDDDCSCCQKSKPIVRLPIVPSKPVAPTKCNCTPATCGCKQKKEKK